MTNADLGKKILGACEMAMAASAFIHSSIKLDQEGPTHL